MADLNKAQATELARLTSEHHADIEYCVVKWNSRAYVVFSAQSARFNYWTPLVRFLNGKEVQ